LSGPNTLYKRRTLEKNPSLFQKLSKRIEDILNDIDIRDLAKRRS